MKISGFKIGNKQFESRLILGTGKYPSLNEAIESINASKTEMVTVAIRRLQKEASHSTQEKTLHSNAGLGQIMVVA